MHDVLIYNIGQINIGIGVAYIVLFLPSFYPGSSMELSSVITALGVIPFAIVYALFAAVYSRSGADYVFASRTLGSFVGFVTSWNFVIWEFFYVGWTAWAFSNLGLSPFFSIIGYSVNSQQLVQLASTVTGTTASFVLGALAIIIFGNVLVFGHRTYFRYQTISALISFTAMVVMAVVLAAGSQQSFALSFNAFSSNVGSNMTYQSVITQAASAGYSTNVPFQLRATVSSILWPFLALAITMMSVSFAGETKSPQKSQLYGILGSELICVLFFVVLTFLLESVVGYNFLGAIAYLYYVQPSSYTLPAAPFFQLFVALLTSSTLVRLIMSLGMVLWSVLWIPVIMLYNIKTIFAWSFDRMAPAALASVSEKYHTPTTAAFFSMAMSIFFLALVVFTPYFVTLVGMLGLALTILVVCIAGIVYPYKKKEEFNNSTVNYKVAGVPIMTIAGVLGALFLIYVIYLFMIDSVVAANTFTNELAVVLVLLFGVVYYVLARAIRKRQGIDIGLVFRQIPPE